MRLDRIIFFCALAACGGTSKKDVESAKRSVYDTDFAIVYSAAMEATRELYPNLDDNPGNGKIATTWHQVQYSNCSGPGSSCDDLVNPRVVAQGQGLNANGTNSPAAVAAGMPTRLAYKRYFIRFDVSVLGGRPWRVKVVGHASEWEPGAAMPTELHGMARPHWLESRTESLEVAIYKRISKYAIPLKQEITGNAEDELPKTDPSAFKGVPPGAAKLLAAIKDELGRRAYSDLEGQLDENVVWSLGGGTGANAAMATWQADPAVFDAMAAAIAAGCGAQTDKRVSCPVGAPVAGTYQLIVDGRGDAWKVSSFVKAE